MVIGFFEVAFTEEKSSFTIQYTVASPHDTDFILCELLLTKETYLCRSLLTCGKKLYPVPYKYTAVIRGLHTLIMGMNATIISGFNDFFEVFFLQGEMIVQHLFLIQAHIYIYSLKHFTKWC